MTDLNVISTEANENFDLGTGNDSIDFTKTPSGYYGQDTVRANADEELRLALASGVKYTTDGTNVTLSNESDVKDAAAIRYIVKAKVEGIGENPPSLDNHVVPAGMIDEQGYMNFYMSMASSVGTQGSDIQADDYIFASDPIYNNGEIDVKVMLENSQFTVDESTFSGMKISDVKVYEYAYSDVAYGTVIGEPKDITEKYVASIADATDYSFNKSFFGNALNGTIKGDSTITIENFANNADADVLVNGVDLATQTFDATVDGESHTYTGSRLKENITGTAGDDTIYGNGGNDLLISGAGDDKMYGGEGNDRLFISGAGTKTVEGGDGNDTFNIIDTNAVVTIADATSADKISFAEIENFGFNNLDFAQAENEKDLVISYKNILGATGKVVVEGYFDQAEADRLTTFNVKGTEYTLEWHYSNVDREYHMYNVTHNPDGAAVEGIRNWINGYTTEPVSITGKSAGDMLAGSINDDTITASDGGSELYGDAGDDHLIGGAGADYIRGKEGNDTLTGNGGADVFAIDSGNDVITDATSADVIKFVDDYRNDFTGITFAKGEGEKATSLMVSFGENSSVEIQNYFNADGTVAENHVNKFAIVTEQAGTKEYTLEWLHSNVDKADHMYNVTHNPNGATVEGIRNWISGYYDGNLEIEGASEGDMLAGSIKDDTITASDGASELYGDAGDDHLIGGAGNDYIQGGSGDDDLYGYGGNDKLITRDGTDKAYGGTGDDHFFIDGAGTKTIEGEEGADTYHIIDLSAVSNITADADDNITFDYSNYKFSDLKFTRDGSDLVISFEKTDNTGSVNVKGFFTAESKIDTINALNDENTPELTAYSILNNADIYVDLSEVNGAYQATDYREVFYGEGTVNGFNNAKDSVESASPVLTRTNNSADLVIDNITITDFDFDTMHPFAIRNGVESQSSTYFPINVTLTNDTEYQATGYAEKINGVGSVNLAGEHPFDRSQDSIVVADVDDVKFTREDNGYLHVELGGTDIAVKGFDFAGSTDFRVTDGETTELTTNITIDVTLTGSDYVSAAGYAERITTIGDSSIQFYPEGEYTGQDTLVFDTENITYKRNGDDLVITHHPDVENEISTTVLGYYASDNMAEEGQFARAQVSAGEINTTLGDLEVSYIENVSNITGTDNEEAIELVTTTGVIPQNASGDFPNYDEETGEYTSNAGHGKIKIDAYATGMGGDDLINGTAGNDWINGGDGGDTIYGGTRGKDMLAGGDGENIILAGDFSGATPAPNTDGVEIYGGKDKDTIYVGGNNETENYIWAHGGDDVINLYGGKNTIMLVEDDRSSAGNDTISGASALDTLKFVSRDGDGEVISGYDFDDLVFAKDGDDLTITTPNDNIVTIAEFFTATSKVDIVKTADRVDAHSIKEDVVFDVVLENGESFNKPESEYAGYRVNIQLADGTTSAEVSGLGEGDNIDIDDFTLSRIYTDTDTTENNVLRINDGLIKIQSYDFDGTPDFTIGGTPVMVGAPLDVYLDRGTYTTTNAFSENIHGFGTVAAAALQAGTNDKLLLTEGATVGYSRTDNGNLIVTAGTGLFADRIEVTGFDFTGGHDIKVNDGTTAGMTINVELNGSDYISASGYAERITTLTDSTVQFYPEGHSKDTLVFNTDSKNVYCERIGNDYVITNSDDAENPVVTTVLGYYTSGDMSVEGRFAGVGMEATDGETIDTTTLGEITIEKISNVAYFDSGAVERDVDETVELTTGLEVGDIDPDKLALDTAGKVRINTTTEKYEYTSSAGYGTVALDAYALGRAGEDTITGTAGNDWINGGADDDAVFGGAGAAGSHDMLSGHDGDDLVVAGEIVEEGTPGAINIGTPDDPQYVLLSDGNAEMYGGIGNDILFGGNANDYLDGGAGNDTLYGNAGNDKLISDAGDDEMYGGEGDDKFFIDGAGTKTVEGGDGNDTFNIIDTNAVVTIADATSADKISFAYLGTGFNFNNLDFAQAENEKDLVISYKNILGANGKVVVEGYFDQAEADRITNFVVGENEYTLKWLWGNNGEAMYNFTNDPDKLVDGIQNWLQNAEPVDPEHDEGIITEGRDKYDMLSGTDYDDMISAGENGAEIYATNGNDFIYGNKGDDVLSGGVGDDTIHIDGQWAGGNDIIYIANTTNGARNIGTDTIYGATEDATLKFSIGFSETDIQGYKFSELDFNRVGNNLEIVAGDVATNKVIIDNFFTAQSPVDTIQAIDETGAQEYYSILDDATILVNLDQFEGETYTATDYTELFTATEPASVKGLKEDDIIQNGDETEFTRANGGPLVINDLITVEDFFTTGLDVDFTVNGVSTEFANIGVTLSDGFVYNSTRYDETISGNGYVMGMEDGDKLAIDGEVEYSRINGGGLTVSGFTDELLNDKITVMDFAFINDGDHDINVNGGTTANATIKVTIKNDYTYDATSYPEVISGEGFVKGMTADDSIVDGTEPAVFSRFNDGGLIINGNIEVLDFFENNVDFKVNGVSTENANIGVVLDDCDYTATRYAETISGTGYVSGMDAAKDKLVVDEVSYARENNGGLLVGGQLLVTDFDFTGGHDIKVNGGTTEGMTIDVTLTGIIGAPYESASGYAERITSTASTAIQFYPEGHGQDTLVFNTSADNLDYARDGEDLIITNGDVVTTVLGYYDSYRMEDAGLFSTVIVDTTTTDTTLGALSVTDIYNVSKVKGTNADEVIELAKVGEDEILTQPEGNDFPNYNPTTGEYTSNATGVTVKAEAYAYANGGNDVVYGTDGNDWINGAAGNDVLYGGADGYDMLSGEAGNDVIIAGEAVAPETEGAVPYRGIVDDGIYTVKLSEGSAEIYGGDGSDLLVGGNGDDYINGGAGNDTLYGNGGDDKLISGAGDDEMYGGAGNDRFFINGAGTKTVEGGDGNDIFNIIDTNAVVTIADSTSADKISFAYLENFGFNNMAFAKAGNNLEITYTELLGATGKVVVEGYFATEDRLTTFVVGDEEYTLKWLADGDGNYAMYNYTDDPTKLVDGIQNWIEDEDPVDPESGIGTVVPGKDKRDVIYGTEYKDIISAGEGGAEIYALEGDDFIYGSEKDDYIAGGEGNDSIYLDGAYAGGSDVIALVNPEGTLKAIGEDTIYGATANTTLLFSLGDGNGYKFNELEFNRVGNNLEIIAGTANDNPNKVIIDGFFTADSRVNTIHALDADFEEKSFSIYKDAEINVDLSQFEGTYHATAFDEVFTGSGSVEGMDKDYDRIVVEGTPVYTRTDNGGLTISTYSESGLLVNEITVEDFNFAGGHDIKVNNGTTEGMTIGVTLTDALDDTYIAAAYAENITVTAENPVNVRGLAAGDNLEIGNDFKFSRTYVGDDSGNDDILTITAGDKVVNVEAYDFTATPAFTIGNTPIMIDAPLDVTAKADYACSNAFSETVLVDGEITVAGFDTAKDKLLFADETTYALDKSAGLTISDDEGHSVTFSDIKTEAGIIAAYVGTFDENAIDDFADKTLSVSGYSVYDGSETEFDSLNITGTAEQDTLTGSDGDDIIDGLAGNDTLTGGKGADTFVISAGSDTITDADAADSIKFAGNYKDLEATAVGTSLLIQSGDLSVTIDNYFDERGKVVADAVDILYALNKQGDYAQYSISDIVNKETYIDFTDYEFSDLTFKRNVNGEHPNDLVITAGNEIKVFENYFTDKNPEDNVRTKDGKFSVLADAEIFVTQGEDGYTGTKYNETINTGTDNQTFDMKTGTDKLNFSFENVADPGEAPEYLMGDFTVKVTSGEQMYLNVPDSITVKEIVEETVTDVTYDILQDFAVDGNDLVISVKYNANEFKLGADPEYFVLGSITVKNAAGKNTGADIYVRNDGEFENVNDHPFVTFSEFDVTDKNTLTGSTIADFIDVSHYITENGKGVKIDSKSGSDEIIGSQYNDTVKASSLEHEHATVTEHGGTNKITTGKGNDIIEAKDYSSNTINAGAGNNTIILDSVGKNTVTAKDGSNIIDISNGSNNVKVGKGNNWFMVDGGTNTIKTGAGENKFSIDNGVNKITTGKKQDEFYISGGNNTISSGAGEDKYIIDGGSNTIKTGNAASYFYLADDGVDANATVYVNNITSGSKNDTFIISDGQNNIKSGSGVDKFYIGYSADPITANPVRDDAVNGGYNVINGGAGDDVFFINSGKSALNGAKGDDRYEVDLTDFNFNAGQIVVTDTAGKNILNAAVDSTDGVLDTLNVFFDVTVKTNKAGTKYKGASYSDMTFTTDVAGADGFDDLDGIDVTSKKAFTTINTYDGEGVSHSATISTKELDKLASDVAGWLFDKGYASTDDVFANEKNDGDIEALVAKYTTFSANDYKM